MASSTAKSSKKSNLEKSKAFNEPKHSDRSEKDASSHPTNVIEYQLSDQRFIELGWTMKPSKRIASKIIQYRTQMAKPHMDWFKLYRDAGTKYYNDLKTPFIVFHSNNSGEVFYPNGRLAIRVNRPKKRTYDTYTVFTPGGIDFRGYFREPQIMAVFDGLGNGIILNENNDTRLTYNQIGGICLDNPRARSFVWTWSLRQVEPKIEAVYTDVSAAHLEKQLQLLAVKSTKSSASAKTPKSAKSQEEKEVMTKNVETEDRLSSQAVKDSADPVEKSGKDILAPIKIICLRLNEYLSLRIVDRRNISLTFFSPTRSVRIELGTILIKNKPISSHSVDSSEGLRGMLRCRFEFEQLDRSLNPDNSLYDIVQEYRKIELSKHKRRAAIVKG